MTKPVEVKFLFRNYPGLMQLTKCSLPYNSDLHICPAYDFAYKFNDYIETTEKSGWFFKGDTRKHLIVGAAGKQFCCTMRWQIENKCAMCQFKTKEK